MLIFYTSNGCILFTSRIPAIEIFTIRYIFNCYFPYITVYKSSHPITFKEINDQTIPSQSTSYEKYRQEIIKSAEIKFYLYKYRLRFKNEYSEEIDEEMRYNTNFKIFVFVEKLTKEEILCIIHRYNVFDLLNVYTDLFCVSKTLITENAFDFNQSYNLQNHPLWSKKKRKRVIRENHHVRPKIQVNLLHLYEGMKIFFFTKQDVIQVFGISKSKPFHKVVSLVDISIDKELQIIAETVFSQKENLNENSVVNLNPFICETIMKSSSK